MRGWYAPEEDGVALDFPNLTLWPNVADMRRVYASARIVLVPSLFPEAFGRVAREAVLNGLPVIASTRGGLTDATWGEAIHLDPEDEAAWTVALRRLWDDRPPPRLSRRAPRAAAATFDPAADFAAFLAFLEDCDRRATICGISTASTIWSGFRRCVRRGAPDSGQTASFRRPC